MTYYMFHIVLSICLILSNPPPSGFANFWRRIKVHIFDNDTGPHLPYGRFSLGILGHYEDIEIQPNKVRSNMFQHFIIPLLFLFPIMVHTHDLRVKSTGPYLQTTFENGMTLSTVLPKQQIHSHTR
jgi:hypothetical protein